MTKKRIIFRGFILAVCFFACSFRAVAQEKISFTWISYAMWYGEFFRITATNGKQFTVNWGDNSAIDTITGTGDWQWIPHIYANYNYYTVNITGLTEESLFTALDYTNNHGQLTVLNTSECTALEELYCSYNQLTDLDLRTNTALKYLYCGGNPLNNLDVSNNTTLTVLNCASNRLSNLDVSKNTVLTILDCGNNQLNCLDVSNNTTLTVLECSWNLLTNLDVSANIALTGLNCSSNKLIALNVSGCKALTYLSCHGNQLNSLDVSNSTTLQVLDCRHNQLTALNVKGCTALQGLSCYYNLLTNLDVSGCIALEELKCYGNMLTVLNVKECIALLRLYCNWNKLTTLDLSKCVALYGLDCSDNQFQLSDLYSFYRINYPNSQPEWKLFGTQILTTQTKNIGDTIDFSTQKVFGGIATDFVVEKNGILATVNDDYSIEHGIIIFNDVGVYTVIMTNEAIVSTSPAQVIAEFYVGVVDITETAQKIPNIKIYPNPTTGQLQITNEQLTITNVEVFDVVGRNVGTYCIRTADNETIIDISHLANGLYFLKIDGKMFKIIRN